MTSRPDADDQLHKRSVLDMSSRQARSFFLKPESYCRLELPPYFDFRLVLRPLEECLTGREHPRTNPKARRCEGVNHTIYSNKDGRYAWRPFEIIHPVIYVDLVNLITEPSAWLQVKRKFEGFAQDPKIRCLSIPQESLTRDKDRGAQVRHWWQGIEQASIELALDYNYVLHADISDCYSSMYTHSIAWAVHGKREAKAKRRDTSLIGNVVDNCIQDMRHGQTNGIPQGSVLLDLIAELVLGYGDFKLSEQLAQENLSDFQILRYRDDYRIFANSPHDGELILKALTEVLIAIGLKLNTSKTTTAQPVIQSSIKMEKLAWMRGRQADRNLQKHILLIHQHGMEFPNAGSLVGALDSFYKRILPMNSIQNPKQIISIAADIGYSNPRCFPACSAVISKALSTLPTKEEQSEIIRRIHKKLAQLPNAGHFEVWLQRISYPVDPQIGYTEELCSLVQGQEADLWNSSWITDARLRAEVDAMRIVDRDQLGTLRPIVRREEFGIFGGY